MAIAVIGTQSLAILSHRFESSVKIPKPLSGLANRWKTRDRICKVLREFLQNSLHIAGGIGLFPALPASCNQSLIRVCSRFDSVSFAQRLARRIFHARRFDGRCGAAVSGFLAMGIKSIFQ